MIQQFRERYPLGSLLTDLLRVEEGIYIVKAQVIVNNTVLSTGIAGSNTVEEAEDAAVKRALNHAGFGHSATPLTLGADSSSRSPYVPTAEFANGQPTPLPISPDPVPAAPKTSPPPPSGLPSSAESATEMEDLSDIIAQTDVELQRIGWSSQKGREFLESRFHKKSRHQLTETELREFLRYLKQQPTCINRDSTSF